jgi:hypothetical protein
MKITAAREKNEKEGKLGTGAEAVTTQADRL